MSARIRNSVRWLAAILAGPMGVGERHARRRRADGRWGVILRYHRVIPADEPPSDYRMGIDARLFEAQIEWLANHAKVVPLDEILRRLEAVDPPDEDLVALTFDDGYRDNRTEAAPILRRKGLPATFYVTSSCLTDRMPFWPETVAQIFRMTDHREVELELANEAIAYRWRNDTERRRCCLDLIGQIRKGSMSRIDAMVTHLARTLEVPLRKARDATPAVMTADDLRMLRTAGFTIGSHTVTHPYLAAEDPNRQKWELEESRRRLEEVLDAPVLDFCYPGGGYDRTTRDLVRDAGYRSAVTSDLGIVGFGDDPYRLVRIGVGQALASDPTGRFSAAMMRSEITGTFTDLYRKRKRRA